MTKQNNLWGELQFFFLKKTLCIYKHIFKERDVKEDADNLKLINNLLRVIPIKNCIQKFIKNENTNKVVER